MRKYGDAVSAATFTLLGVVLVLPELSSGWNGYVVTVTHAVAAIVGCYSWLGDKSSCFMSAVTTLCNVMVIDSMVILNFPSYDDSPFVEMHVWLLLMLSANIDLPCSITTKLGSFIGAQAVAVALYGIPPTAQLDKPKAVAVIVTSTAVFVFLQLAFHGKLPGLIPQKFNAEMATMHGAQIVLAGVFVYNLWADVAAIQLQARLVELHGVREETEALGVTIAALAVKAGFVFVVGLTAVGAFRKNIDVREQLEVLVKQRTEQIEQQDGKLRMFGLALQASETAMAITDEQRRIIWLNPAFSNLAGMKENELKEYSILDVLPLNQDEKARLSRSFSANDTTQLVLNLVDKDKIVNAEVYPLSKKHEHDMHIQNLTKDMHNESYFVVALKDITETVELQRAQKAAEAEGMKAQIIKESMETLTHELRTPLQGIMGVASILVCDNKLKLPQEAKDSLDLIMASSGLLLVLINNLLDVRKCDANMMENFELNPVAAKDPINDSVDFCRPLAKISGVTFDLQLSGAELPIMANTLRLQQVIINLVSNAIKYSSNGSTITVESSVATLKHAKQLSQQALACGPESDDETDTNTDDAKVIVISVRDAGPGISECQEKKLFRKFSQLDSKTQNMDKVGQPSGTGLGLNLCLQFVQLMKGNIWADNNAQGGGASFTFYIPLADTSPDPIQLSERSYEEEKSKDPTPEPKRMPVATRPLEHSSIHEGPIAGMRILVVDDILINRKVLDRMLRKIGIDSVRLAESAEEAMSILDSAEFDLIISDLDMPGGMNGLEFSEALRERPFPKPSNRPIIVGLTADTSPDVYCKCISSGMVDVVHKPITIGDLGDTLLRWHEDGMIIAPE